MSKQVCSMQEKFWSLERTVDKELGKYPVILRLERQSGIKKTNLAGLVIAGLAALLLYQTLPQMVLVMTVVVYPAAMTMQAIEAGDKSHNTQWLAYWLIVAIFTCIDVLSNGVLGAVLPFYGIIKMAACIWMMAPQTRGATVTYEQFIRPACIGFCEHPTVKQAFCGLKKSASDIKVTENVKKAAGAAVNAATKATAAATEN